VTCLACGARGGRFSAGGTARFCDHACFVAWDRRAEAEEALALLSVAGPELVDAAPALRIVRPMRDLAGRRFGSLLVVRRELVARPVHGRPVPRREWLCRCGCGEVLRVSGSRLLRRGVSSCAACAQAARGAARRAAFLADHQPFPFRSVA
jgi:hypothetical protein